MTDLSPAAQAVLDATYEEMDYAPQRHVRWAAAAALRAAVCQVVPYCYTDILIKQDLLAIAAELAPTTENNDEN